MYQNYEQEACSFLGGDYLTSYQIRVPKVPLTKAILKTVNPDILRGFCREALLNKAELVEAYSLGADGRRWVVPFRKGLREEAEMALLLTANPLDFLLSAQEGACYYGSCHSLDGTHAAGNMSFALSKNTLMFATFYTRPDTLREYPFTKAGRMWAHVGDSGKIIAFARRYGRFPLGAAVTATASLESRYPTENWLSQVEYPAKPGQVSGAVWNSAWPGKLAAEYPAFFDALLTRLSHCVGLPEGPWFEYPYPPCLACGQTVTEAAFKYLFCTACELETPMVCANCATMEGPLQPDPQGRQKIMWCERCYNAVIARCPRCGAMCRDYNRAGGGRGRFWCLWCDAVAADDVDDVVPAEQEGQEVG